MSAATASWLLPDPEATERLGALIAARCPWEVGQPLTVHLRGDLGTGKTTLVRGLLRSLGHEDAVRSPSYSLIEIYELASGRVVHADLYRLRSPAELEQTGIRDECLPGTLLLLEWPERGGSAVPDADLVVQLGVEGTGRRASIASGSRMGTLWRSQLARDIAVKL